VTCQRSILLVELLLVPVPPAAMLLLYGTGTVDLLVPRYQGRSSGTHEFSSEYGQSGIEKSLVYLAMMCQRKIKY
jgi:hypothetical protein